MSSSTKKLVPDVEQALEFDPNNVGLLQNEVRSEVMDAFESSVDRNRDLLQRLAKECQTT